VTTAVQLDADQLVADYAELGSIRKAARRHGVSYSTARCELIRAGAPIAPVGRQASVRLRRVDA
jgi:hypothetical protein